MNLPEVGVGIIGAGDISLYHSEGLARCPGAIRKGYYDPITERAQKRAQEFGGRVYASAEELVSDPTIDAVLILTPLEKHFATAKQAIEAGKHVLVEKPVGVNIDEIKELKRLAEQKGVICMLGHNNVYDPKIREIGEMIKEGLYGELSAIYMLYNIYHSKEAAAKYPGVIRLCMTHLCYTTLYWAGEPKGIQAMQQRQRFQLPDKEDIAMVNLAMRNGALVHLETNIAADDHSSDPWSYFFKVIGQRGAGRYSHNDSVVNDPGMVHSHTYAAYPRSIYAEDNYFVNSCIRGGNKSLSTLDDAMVAQRMIEAIELSIAERRTVDLSEIKE